ncbi:MAG: glycosyltransferase family 2 protein [Chloroflexi bacterium]|nr:glycosyltransferase family 2 protein [Chloroflexota bacterium]
MNAKRPRVSIGLPVYNAERFLEQALDGILAQTFTDFELVICDNASTDRTQEICRRYAANDARIKYHRNSHNIGVSRNFNRTFELATGEYFKWCAHDDIPRHEFLEKCVEVLDKHQDVVLCYTRGIGIDENGAELRQLIYTMRTDSPKPHERFRDLVMIEHPMFMLFGVVRADMLRRTPLLEHYPSSDRVLMARLGLLGPIYRVPDFLHLNREYPGTSVKKYGDNYRLMAMYNPDKEGKISFPSWAMFFGYLKAIFAYPLSLQERYRCLKVLWQWSFRRRRKFVRDITRAVKHPLRPLAYRLLGKPAPPSYYSRR